MTYGQLRIRLLQLFPGLGQEMLDGWIQDTYTEILDSLPWKRQEDQSIFQCAPSYQVGTLSATQGSAAVTGSGTTWDDSMSGAVIRIASGTEFYTFTRTGATVGSLDRPFEQPSASGLAYRIDRATFALPDGCRILRAIKPVSEIGRIDLISPGELDRLYPQRTTYGSPRWAAATWDTQGDPPKLQVELYPIPNSPNSVGKTLSFSVDYIYDPADIDPRQTGMSVLPWTRPAALIEGVQARVCRWRADSDPKTAGPYLATAAAHEKKFADLVHQMARTNAFQRGPQPLQLAPELRRQVPGYYRRGPWRRGGNG